MIPFYPIGEGKQNGNGLPMAYCLALQGLKDPLAPVFTQEVEGGKKFVSFMLTVSRLFVEFYESNNVHTHSGRDTTLN
jgi:hypothetical protein